MENLILSATISENLVSDFNSESILHEHTFCRNSQTLHDDIRSFCRIAATSAAETLLCKALSTVGKKGATWENQRIVAFVRLYYGSTNRYTVVESTLALNSPGEVAGEIRRIQNDICAELVNQLRQNILAFGLRQTKLPAYILLPLYC